jgi:hypothetical protein
MNSHPSQVIHGAILFLEERFQALRIISLMFWTNMIRKAQKRQDDLNTEHLADVRRLKTYFEHAMSDGKIDEKEAAWVRAKLDEMETQHVESKVIKG